MNKYNLIITLIITFSAESALQVVNRIYRVGYKVFKTKM